MSVSAALRWLYREWPYAVFFTAPFLLLLYPFIVAGLGLPFALIYLQMPLYMVHQVEEHYHDRFRTFINKNMGMNKEVLTPAGTFAINSLGVWGIDLLAIYLAFYGHLALGLMAIYLALLNGITHVIAAFAKRTYNPGLVTSVLLFIPIGIWSEVVVSEAGHATASDQAIGIGTAIFVHLCIIVYFRVRLRKLRREEAAAGS